MFLAVINTLVWDALNISLGFERLQESKGTLCAEESGKEEDNSVICVSLHPVSALQWGKRQEAAHYKINLKFYKRVLPQREIECQTDFFFKEKEKNEGGKKQWK